MQPCGARGPSDDEQDATTPVTVDVLATEVV